jgi:hypothetical protein
MEGRSHLRLPPELQDTVLVEHALFGVRRERGEHALRLLRLPREASRDLLERGEHRDRGRDGDGAADAVAVDAASSGCRSSSVSTSSSLSRAIPTVRLATPASTVMIVILRSSSRR